MWIQRDGWACGSAATAELVCVAEGLAIAGGIGLLTFAVLSTAAAAVMAVAAAWMDGWMKNKIGITNNSCFKVVAQTMSSSN